MTKQLSFGTMSFITSVAFHFYRFNQRVLQFPKFGRKRNMINMRVHQTFDAGIQPFDVFFTNCAQLRNGWILLNEFTLL